MPGTTEIPFDQMVSAVIAQAGDPHRDFAPFSDDVVKAALERLSPHDATDAREALHREVCSRETRGVSHARRMTYLQQRIDETQAEIDAEQDDPYAVVHIVYPPGTSLDEIPTEKLTDAQLETIRLHLLGKDGKTTLPLTFPDVDAAGFRLADPPPESIPGAPISDTDLTHANDGSVVPLDPERRPPKDRPVRLTVAQRAWGGDRRAETAEQITGGLGVSWVDLEGFDPDGNPVTLRTSAISHVELFAEGPKSVHSPVVALALCSPVNLIYVDLDGRQLTAGSLYPADLDGSVKVGWPDVLEDRDPAGDWHTRELTPEQENQLREADRTQRAREALGYDDADPSPAEKVESLVADLEQSVADAKAARERAQPDPDPITPGVERGHVQFVEPPPLPGRVTTTEDAPAGDVPVVLEDVGPQGETIVTETLDPPVRITTAENDAPGETRDESDE